MSEGKVRKRRSGIEPKDVKYHVLSYRLNRDEYRQMKKISQKKGEFISSLTRWAVQAFLGKGKEE